MILDSQNETMNGLMFKIIAKNYWLNGWKTSRANLVSTRKLRKQSKNANLLLICIRKSLVVLVSF